MLAIQTFVLFALSTTNFLAVYGIECNQPRSDDDPAGASIASVLEDGIKAATSEDHYNHVITATTFAHEHGSMTFKVTSLDESLQMDDAKLAFSTIVTECIEKGNFWGGSVTTSGCTYEIFNNVYPQGGTENLEKRAKPKTKQQTKTSKAAAPMTSKAGTPPTTPIPATPPPATPPPATPPKSSSSLKLSSTTSSPTASASATTDFANKCAQIGRRDTEGQLSERRDIEDMGFVTRDLHELIVKRGAKSGTGCGIKVRF
jgi:hypothetical protein